MNATLVGNVSLRAMQHHKLRLPTRAEGGFATFWELTWPE